MIGRGLMERASLTGRLSIKSWSISIETFKYSIRKPKLSWWKQDPKTTQERGRIKLTERPKSRGEKCRWSKLLKWWIRRTTKLHNIDSKRRWEVTLWTNHAARLPVIHPFMVVNLTKLPLKNLMAIHSWQLSEKQVLVLEENCRHPDEAQFSRHLD